MMTSKSDIHILLNLEKKIDFILKQLNYSVSAGTECCSIFTCTEKTIRAYSYRDSVVFPVMQLYIYIYIYDDKMELKEARK